MGRDLATAMIIWLRQGHTDEQLAEVVKRVTAAGCRPEVHSTSQGSIVRAIGDATSIDEGTFRELPWVERTARVTPSYRLVARAHEGDRRVVRVGGVEIGGGRVVIMAGPCSVEGMEMLLPLAEACRSAGAEVLRGGAYKPRTSPYSFQGLGREGVRCLVEARRRTGMPIVTEATGIHRHAGPGGIQEERTVLEEVLLNADMLQVGSRNMKSYGFLEEVARRTGERGIPVLLKRGEAATTEEFLLAAEYLALNGNPDLVLCLRGVRAYETDRFLRYTPDLGTIPVLKRETNLPVVFDPSHATGDRALVHAVSLAAVAAGADGLLIETHMHPENAWSDGQQCVDPGELARIVGDVRRMEALGFRQ